MFTIQKSAKPLFEKVMSLAVFFCSMGTCTAHGAAAIAHKKANILMPKDNLQGANKPGAIVLFHPLDEHDGAVDPKYIYGVLEGWGYSVFNKPTNARPELNSQDFLDDTSTFIKVGALGQKKRQKNGIINLFLIGHGAPGWFFSSQGPLDEAHSTARAAAFIAQLEAKLGITFANVILQSCFSAVEAGNEETGNHFNSPARMLSKKMDRHVLGYLGKLSDAKVSVYDAVGGDPVLHSLAQSSLLFKAGKLADPDMKILAPQYFITGRYVKSALAEAVGISRDSHDYLQVRFGATSLSTLDSASTWTDTESTSFGEKQLAILGE